MKGGASRSGPPALVPPQSGAPRLRVARPAARARAGAAGAPGRGRPARGGGPLPRIPLRSGSPAIAASEAYRAPCRAVSRRRF
jgi:hypothetical protein